MTISIPKGNRVLLSILLILVGLGAGLCLWLAHPLRATLVPPSNKQRSTANVCPPFHLKDETGKVIDPVRGVNDKAPYSPRRTCGTAGCHNYEKITQGFHFTQGRGEPPPADMKARYDWITSPGNYGGNWCSPAPLYRYLSPVENKTAKTMDMTSFTFITAGCGNCHPGGGPVELDRKNRRYDEWMRDPASGMKSGGDNGLNGDYHKAQWSETGVMEADCLLCHLPDYRHEKRNAELKKLNFRWAATSGAGLGEVTGSVADKKKPVVAYDKTKFNEDGTLIPRMAVHPRNKACLACHEQPGWKKRGADYRARTDVHLRAGLRCVDCHPAGSRSVDPLAREREVHQFGKGDDPGGRVRDDLDGTVRDCAACHTGGDFGAPVAHHRNLPPLHLARLSCQACHITEKMVKPIQLQASDVFNPDPLIQKGGKQLWTFYGPEGTYRNHYGILHMMGYDDKPTESFRPVLARYKGKIYPVNRIHSAWPGIEDAKTKGLLQPRMTDIFKMWSEYRAAPSKHPDLAVIRDDNGDGVLEVNRPEEIAGLISAVTKHLTAIGYPLEGGRVVWVSNERVYSSGTEFRAVEKHEWEASPFANTHKYNHDVQPAQAALGSNGCTDCHHRNAPFFTQAVLKRPFDADQALPEWVPNHEILGISAAAVRIGGFRESLLKPAAGWILLSWLLILLLHYVIFGRKENHPTASGEPTVERFDPPRRFAHYLALSGFLILAVTGIGFFVGVSYLNGAEARAIHAWIGWFFAVGWFGLLLLFFKDMFWSTGDSAWLKHAGGYFTSRSDKELAAGRFNAGQKLFFWFVAALGSILVLTGAAMAVFRARPDFNLSILYSLHDLTALTFLLTVVTHVYLGILANPSSLGSIFGGAVGISWLRENHPQDPSHHRGSPTHLANR